MTLSRGVGPRQGPRSSAESVFSTKNNGRELKNQYVRNPRSRPRQCQPTRPKK